MHGNMTATPGQGLRSVRIQRGMSQRAIAALVGTDSAHIARLEADAQTCRLALAKKLAVALDCSLDVLYPQAAKVLRLKRPTNGSLSNKETAELAEHGIDAEPEHWLVKVLTRGGGTSLFYMDAHDHNRLFDAVQRVNPIDGPFFVFDSDDRRVLINLDHALFCHLLFEPQRGAIEEPNYANGYVLLAEFSSGPTAFEFTVEPDDLDEDAIGQIGSIFQSAEFTVSEGANFIANFIDVDGETVFVRMNDVAILSVPIPVVAPSAEDELEPEAANDG